MNIVTYLIKRKVYEIIDQFNEKKYACKVLSNISK